MNEKDKSTISFLISIIQNKREILEKNEAQTRWMLIDTMLLEYLGYSRQDIIVEYYYQESTINRIDYIIMLKNRPKIILEAKSLGTDLLSNYSQLYNYYTYILKEYNYEIKDLIGVLSDGNSYFFYKTSENGKEMNSEPFFLITLNIAEDYELEYLKSFSKEIIEKTHYNKMKLIEYELNTAYNIELYIEIENYFKSKGIKTKINEIYINGRKKEIGSLIKLYRYVVKEIENKYPEALKDYVYSEYNMKIVDFNSVDVLFQNIPKKSENILNRLLDIINKVGYMQIMFSLGRKGF